MTKTILITGSTDGIGLATAKKMASLGHNILLHGRNIQKLQKVEEELRSSTVNLNVDSYSADFSKLSEVEAMADSIVKKHPQIDVLINNAGVLKTKPTKTEDGLDVRFVVNTIAPYLLTKKLLPILGKQSRVVNLSSAAQAPVNISALMGEVDLSDFDAYAQSKLALTMWSFYLSRELENDGPVVIAVNPGSLLGSKMVKEGFGTEGKDISIGANILTSIALDNKYKNASGKYFDNDLGEFAPPHNDGLNSKKIDEVIRTIELIIKK